MAIKAIIFDLGGVLLRTQDFSMREQLAERLNMDRHELEELFFDGDSGDRAQRGEITTQQHAENLRYQLGLPPQEFEDVVEEFFASDKLDEELVDYIRDLHKTYKTALLSNSTDDLRQRIASKWHFEDAFDFLIISAEVKIVKPDPRIFQLALEGLGVDAAEAIFVDDFQHNVEAAESLGMQAIRFQNPQQVRDDLERIIHG